LCNNGTSHRLQPVWKNVYNNLMSIISTCMFSDQGEIELLYAKITTEEILVSSWVIVEAAYTFRGDCKPLILGNLIKNDSRFKPYLERIHVVEVNKNLVADFKYGVKYLLRKKLEIYLRKLFFHGHENQQRLLFEKKFFYAEHAQRDAAIPKILELSADGDDWILVADLDEILNLSNIPIKNSVVDIMNSKELFAMLLRQKFAFDFDNLDAQQRYTPLVNVQMFKLNSEVTLSEFRDRFDGVPYTEHPYITEYTFCFSRETIFNKYATFPHVAPTEEKILEGLEINAYPIYDYSSNHDIRWLKKVDILDYSVPQYIIDNIERLKTHNVDQNYHVNRKIKFPNLFI
jgi:hypothetical protein